MPQPDDDFDDDGFEEFHQGLYEEDVVEEYTPDVARPSRPAKRPSKSRRSQRTQQANSQPRRAKLPVRKSRRTSRSVPKNQTKRKRKSRLRSALRRRGRTGWIISGGVVGLSFSLLAMLTGYSESEFVVSFLNSSISIVTGLAVGRAVRYVARPTPGWAPSVTAVTITLCVILLSKFGAAYIWIHNRDAVLRNQLYEQQVENLTNDGAMISAIAQTVHEEWLLAGKITEDEVEEFWIRRRVDPKMVLKAVIGGKYNYSEVYLPKVWEEATNRWDKLTRAEQQKEREKVLKLAGITRESVAAQVADDRKPVTGHEKRVKRYGGLLYSIFLVFLNCVWPPHAPLFLIMCLFCAFLTGASESQPR